MAQMIALSLLRSGRKCRWYFEMENPNPVGLPFKDEAFIIEESHDKWMAYFDSPRNGETTEVFDGRFLHLNVAITLTRYSADSEDVCRRMLSLPLVINGSDSLLIYLTTSDIVRLFENTFQSRDLRDWYIEQSENALWCKKRGLKGIDSLYALYSEVDRIQKAVFDAVQSPKMEIDISGLNWQSVAEKTLERLAIPHYGQFGDIDHCEFAGKYSVRWNDQQRIVHIEKQNTGLFLHRHPFTDFPGFEQVLTLIAWEKDSFIPKGHPLRFDFERDECGRIARFRQNGLFGPAFAINDAFEAVR